MNATHTNVATNSLTAGSDANKIPAGFLQSGKISVSALFNWLRGGNCYEDNQARLDECAKYFGGVLKDYIDGELKSTIEYWADWARVWLYAKHILSSINLTTRFTFGLVCSTMQESVHWSLKSQLEGQCVAPHQLIQFLIQVLSNRQTNISRRMRTDTNLKNLASDLAKVGCKQFIDAMNRFVLPCQQFKLLSELSSAQAYKVSRVKVNTEEDSDEIKEILSKHRRGVSAFRFSMLDFSAGKLFQLKHSEKGTTDFVYVSPKGSVACTCGELFETGIFDRHILAVYRQEKIALNFCTMMHPACLINKVTPDLKAACVGPANLIAKLDLSAPWDELVQATENDWKQRGLGPKGAEALSNVIFTADTCRREPSARELFEKKVYQFLEMGKRNPDLQNQFNQFFAGVLNANAASGVVIAPTKESSKRKKPAAEKKRSAPSKPAPKPPKKRQRL